MISDIIALIKYTGLFVCSFYCFIKLSQIKFRLINILDLLATVLFAAALYYATKHLRLLVPIGFLILTFLYSWARYRKPVLNTVTMSTISCGITIATMAAAGIVTFPLGIITFRFIPNETVRNIITVCVVFVLQIVAVFLICRIKRLKSGISIQNSNGTIEFLLLASILSIFLMTLLYTDNISDSPATIIVITITFCGLALIVWWKKHVTGNYQKELYKRNENYYEQRLAENENERAELLKQNKDLAEIIHRDNKFIPAMEAAVEMILEKEPDNKDYQQMLSQLKILYAERYDAINTYQSKADNLPKTESSALNGIIRFVNSQAVQNNISAEFEVNGAAIHSLTEIFKGSLELNTLILDLGINAIIAAKGVADGKILIAFEITEVGPSISFYDNGPPFDKAVIENMGKKRITTHKNDGGSGIGLMTLFGILNKYNASYHLNEKTEKYGFTKCVKISFDNQHTTTIE